MIDELKWQYLTGVVSNIKSPNQFLKRLLMGRVETLEVETVRIETISAGREIAPFVRKNGEAIMDSGYAGGGYSVDAPNIRIKRPFTPSDMLYNRPIGNGTIMLPTDGALATAVEQHIQRDLTIMENMIVNNEEYLTALMLQGTITYAVADEEVFQITYPKPSGNNILMTTFLDDATPADVRYLAFLRQVKQIISDDGSPNVTDAICGSEAADALDELVESGALTWLNSPSGNNGIAAGTYSFVENFDADGVIYMGMIGGIRHWRYARTATLNGTTVNMIRPKYIEYVSTNPATERVMYYAAIPDVDALQNRRYRGTRFSKSWTQPDPSALMSLVHSRPLPVPRRPGANVSAKVVSG